MNIIVGSHVWTEDPSLAWIDGQVTKINGQEAEVQRSDGKKVHFKCMVSILIATTCSFYVLVMVQYIKQLIYPHNSWQDLQISSAI